MVSEMLMNQRAKPLKKLGLYLNLDPQLVSRALDLSLTLLVVHICVYEVLAINWYLHLQEPNESMLGEIALLRIGAGTTGTSGSCGLKRWKGLGQPRSLLEGHTRLHGNYNHNQNAIRDGTGPGQTGLGKTVKSRHLSNNGKYRHPGSAGN